MESGHVIPVLESNLVSGCSQIAQRSFCLTSNASYSSEVIPYILSLCLRLISTYLGPLRLATTSDLLAYFASHFLQLGRLPLGLDLSLVNKSKCFKMPHLEQCVYIMVSLSRPCNFVNPNPYMVRNLWTMTTKS